MRTFPLDKVLVATNFSLWSLKVQMLRTPMTLATSTAMGQEGGLTLPSLHKDFSESKRGQSEHLIGAIISPMLPTWALAGALMGQTATITYIDGAFELKTQAQSLKVATERYVGPPPFPSDNVTLSYAGRQISFDAKGLGIRQGAAFGYSRLPSLAMTTKLFGNAEIKETKEKITSGVREAGFSALSGFEYVGSTLYLLLRWEEKNGTPWMEALVGIDLSKQQLQPALIGRFDGMSYATGRVDDRLEFRDGRLAAFTVKGTEWGMASIVPENGAKTFTSFGPKAASARPIPGGSKAIGLSPSGYGTTLVTLVDLGTSAWRMAAEIRGQIRGVVEPNVLHWREGSQNVYTNLETGAELRPGWDPVPVHTSLGLLMWSPSVNPDKAFLYDTESFRVVGSWTAPPPPAVPPVTPTTPPVRPPVGSP